MVLKFKINRLRNYYHIEGLLDITDGGLVKKGFELMIHTCNKYMTKDIRYLDVGSAECFYIEKLMQSSSLLEYCIGVDISSPKLKRAHKRISCNEFHIVNSTWDFLPFKENVFNLVTYYDGLEHAINPELPLKQIHHVLDNGILLLTTIIIDPIVSLSEIFEIIINRTFFKLTGMIFRGHLNCFTTKQITSMVSKDYEIIDVRTNLQKIKMYKKIQMQLKSIKVKILQYVNFISKKRIILSDMDARAIFSLVLILKTGDVRN